MKPRQQAVLVAIGLIVLVVAMWPQPRGRLVSFAKESKPTNETCKKKGMALRDGKCKSCKGAWIGKECKVCKSNERLIGQSCKRNNPKTGKPFLARKKDGTTCKVNQVLKKGDCVCKKGWDWNGAKCTKKKDAGKTEPKKEPEPAKPTPGLQSAPVLYSETRGKQPGTRYPGCGSIDGAPRFKQPDSSCTDTICPPGHNLENQMCIKD